MKKRSNLLVAIGVTVFLLGSGLVLLSFGGSSKAAGARVPANTGAASTPVVVATKAIPAGTTGETLIESHSVTLGTAPAGSYRSDDLVSLQALNQEALVASVAAGQPIEAANLHLNVGVLSPPAGDESVALSLASGVSGGGGYLAPGDNVDVYGTITKASTATATGAPAMSLPCTALVESSVEILDISDQVAPYRSNPSAAGRTVPASITVLVAATPAQARRLIFYTSVESLYLTKASPTEKPVSKGACAAMTTTPQLVPAS